MSNIVIGEFMNYDDITKLIVKDCLQIIADKGNFEAGSVDAFNAIKEKYEIDADYNDLAFGDDCEYIPSLPYVKQSVTLTPLTNTAKILTAEVQQYMNQYNVCEDEAQIAIALLHYIHG